MSPDGFMGVLRVYKFHRIRALGCWRHTRNQLNRLLQEPLPRLCRNTRFPDRCFLLQDFDGPRRILVVGVWSRVLDVLVAAVEIGLFTAQ